LGLFGIMVPQEYGGAGLDTLSAAIVIEEIARVDAALARELRLAAVILIGRWQGVRSLVGLALSLLLVVTFVVPAVLAGREPIAVAVVGSLAILIPSIFPAVNSRLSKGGRDPSCPIRPSACRR
jgi:hypothetical protein